MDKGISRRIAITRYFMVIGIVILHLPPTQTLSELGTSFLDIIRAFFTYGAFRTTVPVLTVLSGFLLFRSGLHFQPLKLLSKKTTSILVPMLIWNIPVVIILYFTQKSGVITHGFTTKLYPVEFYNWLNALTGMFENPANYPLNFLRDLYVVSLLSPLYWLFLKKAPYIGLLCVILVAYFNLDGYLLRRYDLMISFYIGGLAATQNWDLKYLDRYAKWLLAIFIAASLVIALYDIENIFLFRLFSPFMVWPAMSLLVDTKFGDFLFKNANSSFFTFLAHGPLLFIIWTLFQQLPVELPNFVFWLVTPPLIVYLSILLRERFIKYTPKLAAVALGGR